VTLDQLLAELDDLQVTASRGLVVEAHCRADRRTDVVARLAGHLGPDAVVVAADGSPAARQRLAELNTGRDAVLKQVPAVVLVVTTGDETRWARGEAPDLTAAFDLVAEVEEQAPGTWAGSVAAIRATLAERHRAIDLTGLVPASGEVVELPLDETYLQAAGIDADTLPTDQPTLVHGPPGAGKTTSLRWLCRRHAVGAPPSMLPERGVVLLVPLSAWWAKHRDAPVALQAFVERDAGTLCGVDRVDLGGHLGDMVLLFDGLDEVPSQDARRAVIEQAAALQRGGAVVVVTGREHVAGAVGEDWNLVKMRVPGEAEATALIRSVLAARGRVDAEQTTETVTLSLKRHNELASFARNPLILVFVAVLADLGGALPTVRIELYRDLIEMLVTSWRRLRSGNGAPPLRRADVFRVLAQLGWEMVRRGVGGLSEAELVEALVPLERRRHPDDEGARQAASARIAQLRDDTALLRTGETWSFVHPTFAEYFAALAALNDEDSLSALVADPYADEWSVVVPFTVALATEIEARDDVAERLVTALMTAPWPERDAEATRTWRVLNRLVTVLTDAPGLRRTSWESVAAEVYAVALTIESPWELVEVLGAVLGLSRSDGATTSPHPSTELLVRLATNPRILRMLVHDRLWSVTGDVLVDVVGTPLSVALLRHADTRVRREAWARGDWAAMSALDSEIEAPGASNRHPGFYEAAVEVYGEEAVRAAGLAPDPAEAEPARRAG
jgi:hypothetical protein